MPTVHLRPTARRDLKSIHRWIAKEAPMRAPPFMRRLDKTLRTLAERPQIGSRRLPRYPDIRVFSFGRYLIIYQPLDRNDGIDVVRVYHGAQDWPALIDDDLT